MNTRGPLSDGARWYEVLLAILPGLFVIASKGGLLQVVGGPSLPFGSYNALAILCLALVLGSLLWGRRFAVWSHPALGILLPLGIFAVVGAAGAVMSEPIRTIQWVQMIVPLLLALALWGTMLLLAVHYRVGPVAPKAFWILFGASVGAFALPYGMDVFTSNGDRAAVLPVIAAVITMFPGMCLLPILIAWPLARRYGTTAVLVILGAEFFFSDVILDTGYALRMLTHDATLTWLVYNAPAIGFLIISPLWVLKARSFRSQAIGFLLPPSVALAVTEVLSGSVRTYFTPDMWFRRGLGAAAFIFILAMTIVAYHAIQSDRLGPENELPPAQGGTQTPMEGTT